MCVLKNIYMFLKSGYPKTIGLPLLIKNHFLWFLACPILGNSHICKYSMWQLPIQQLMVTHFNLSISRAAKFSRVSFLARARCLSAGLRYLRLARPPRASKPRLASSASAGNSGCSFRGKASSLITSLRHQILAGFGEFAFWMTGRSKSRPNDHLLNSWAGISACDRPGIPPSPSKQRSKCRCCKESYLIFLNHCFGGVRGNVRNSGG